jgi:predicted RNA-binding Zn-ribbon protein involved in translation (DUF1610 family)
MEHQFCPGARILRQPRPEIFDCPSCGAEVEIWTDEIRGACSNCGRVMFREGHMSCLEWCNFAQECMGEEAYDRYMENRTAGLRRRLLEAVRKHWAQEDQEVRRAEAALSWSEKILKEVSADWHIVIPASILHTVGGDRGSGGFRAAREILLRSGLKSEDIEKIFRIAKQDPSEHSVELDVVHDAVILAESGAKEAAEAALRTDTGKRLAGSGWSDTP